MSVEAPSSGRDSPWAWVGATLFALSLGYFLFTYAVTFGEPAGTFGEPDAGTPSVPAMAWNAALFLLFAVHHSLFARARMRTLVARTVPADLERTVYVISASLLFFAVVLLWRPVPGLVWHVQGPATWALRLGVGCGVMLTVWSASIVGIRSLAGLAHASQAEFKVSGPYGWVRHPIYAGWFLIVFSVPVMTATRLEFAAISAGYLLVAMPWEERSLAHAAGAAYERYRERVRWKIVPGLY